MEPNMTALISCFARAYHNRTAPVPVFADPLAETLLSAEETETISRSMTEGIAFFAPEFSGSREDALAYITNRFLAPPVLARGAFCKDALHTAVTLGCRQYVLFGAGFDTFPFRCPYPGLRVFALDRPEMLADLARRRNRAGLKETCAAARVPCDLARGGWQTTLLDCGFDRNLPAFGSLLGLTYYLSREAFGLLLETLSPLWVSGSSLCFDYPTPDGGEEGRKTRTLAAGAGAPMQAAYPYGEMEQLLARHGFLIYENLDEKEATERFFKGSGLSAPAGVHYCLAVKKPR